MTGGRVIIIGKTGVNFAAGMSGGIAYVLDENQLFDTRCNLEMVDIEPVTESVDADFLHRYIKKHVKYTQSKYATQVIKEWDEYLPYFVKVIPVEYRRALERIKDQDSRDSDQVGMTEEVYV
jgi:glutamate synthase domain-containing protein 3